ncbi:MAG TPA: DUF2252 domain-containing protein [Ktedonobacterales bacterium]|nr:DUF2252 domain-containing protein [Ktedonobacterales bacterium]
MVAETTHVTTENTLEASESRRAPRSSAASLNGHSATSHVTLEERRARGRALREKTPRSSHAFWAEAPDRTDPLTLLEAQATTRLPDLVPIRYARMRVSPFAFLRGSAVVMAQDLAQTPRTGIQTQLCGDCHCSNFGAYASPERTLLFDINDLDETYPGPWEWDVKRLAASVFVAGRDNGFTEAENRNAVIAAVRSYRQHMAELAGMRTLDVWYARVTADDLLDLILNKQTKKQARKQMAKARQRDSAQVAAKLTEVVDGHRIIANDPPLIMRVTEDELGGEVRTLFEQYTQSLRGAQHRVLERLQIVDVARKVVGVGSVGTRCFIVLLTGRDDDDPLFLQVKEAEASVLEAYLPKCGYKHQGERVVAGQELMQAASDIFLGWMTGPAGRDFYWRQLRDMKGSVEVETLSSTNLALYAGLCGWALARAHARASGNAVEIAAYLGASDTFDKAIASFAEAYANQTERDYQALLAAIKSGRIVAATAG